MQEYIVTIKTSKGEEISTTFTAKSIKDAKEQMDVFFKANYEAPDRISYVVKDAYPVSSDQPE